jgi:hypothetical protein
MPREDFFEGRWRCHLDALFALPRPRQGLPTHGDAVLAEALMGML